MGSRFSYRFKARVIVVVAVITGIGGWGCQVAPPARKLPVLPFPKHAVVSETPLGTYPTSVNWRGLDSSMADRLNPHWAEAAGAPRPGSERHAISIGLLGKDDLFDKQAEKAASRWSDSLGGEGYVLILRNDGCLLAARTETGLFYGMQTFRQLREADWATEVVIADWPSFPLRAVSEDISRGLVPTVNFLQEQIRRMASVKINYLSFYTEHVVKTVSHPDFAPPDGNLSIADLKALSAYAERYHMELIGNFQSFGHFKNILSLPQYAAMGATSELISPVDPRAKAFLRDVIGELADAYDAPWFNVNCDETFDLGQGTTQPYVAREGLAAVYAGHIRYLNSILKAHGKQLMMWGDFGLDHPEVFKLLPGDITYLSWEYGDNDSYDRWIRPFSSRNLPFVVCPGILNTYRLFPDMVMARGNIAGFAEAGFRGGARGLMTTIWGDGDAYLLSGDWYGIYLTAEKGWAAGDPATMDDFDERFGEDAFGVSGRGYVKALHQLMKLRDIPITYDLSYRLWRQRLLPEKDRQLILNNVSAEAALRELDSAAGLLNAFKPARHEQDTRALQLAIDQYRLLLRSRLFVSRLARFYKEAFDKGTRVPQMSPVLSRYEDSVRYYEMAYQALEDRFRKAWLQENQRYWLEEACKPFGEKTADLASLHRLLGEVLGDTAGSGKLPPAARVRLAIEDTRYFYFSNWMLAGPFPPVRGGTFPSFLYSDSAAYDKPPKPGDFTSYHGKRYRWVKYAGDNGGIIDLNERYGGKASLAYAYCVIKSAAPRSLAAVLETDGEAAVFCNGEEVTGRPDSVETSPRKHYLLTLPLVHGQNHIVIKLARDVPRLWSYRFYLPGSIFVTSHKHKYQLHD